MGLTAMQSVSQTPLHKDGVPPAGACRSPRGGTKAEIGDGGEWCGLCTHGPGPLAVTTCAGPVVTGRIPPSVFQRHQFS
jgi:hypothetical protein